MISIVIIGLGNIGTHLYKAFNSADGITVSQLYNRTQNKLNAFPKALNSTTDLSKLIEADVYIIATSDDSIDTISSALPFTNKLVVHTSGSVPIHALANKNRKGSFYPLQTFSNDTPINFKEVPICIEAQNTSDLLVLQNLAEKLSNKVFHITSEQRKSMHLAAVFANNFTNHMYYIAEQICKENNVPFTILSPLLKETAQKLDTLSPYNAQTGPAKRNDIGTIDRHLKELTNTSYKEIYTAISKSITNTYEKKL